MTMHLVTAAFLESGLKEIRYLPYSPKVAPSDYHLFPNLKKHLHGRRFSTNDELKYTTEEWLKEQLKLFYFTGIQNL